MIQRVPLFLDFRLSANSPGAFLALCGTLLGSGLLPLAARGLGGLHSLPYGLPGEHPHHRVHHHIPYPSHVVTELSPLQRKGGPLSDPPFRLPLVRNLVGLLRALDAASPGGIVLDVDLFAPHVLLDDLGVFHNVLADADLFLDHRTLADDDLFLGHGHAHLVFADLGLRGLTGDRYPLNRHFLVASGHRDLLVVCAHALSDLELTGLALSCASDELFLGPLHPQLVAVFKVGSRALIDALVVLGMTSELARLGVALVHARSDLAGVPGVGAAILGARYGAQAVVGANLVLVLRGDLTVVIEGRAVLDDALGLGDFDDASLMVCGGDVHRDQGGAGAEEAHLHAEVLWLIVLVKEQIVYLADLRPAFVHHGVASILVFYRRESVAAMLMIHALPPRDAPFRSSGGPHRSVIRYVRLYTLLLGKVK